MTEKHWCPRLQEADRRPKKGHGCESVYIEDGKAYLYSHTSPGYCHCGKRQHPGIAEVLIVFCPYCGQRLTS